MGRSAVKSACSLCHGDLGVSTRTVPTVTVEPACEACWSKIEAGALDLPAMERSPPDPGSRAELVERIVHAASRAAMFFGEQAAEDVEWAIRNAAKPLPSFADVLGILAEPASAVLDSRAELVERIRWAMRLPLADLTPEHAAEVALILGDCLAALEER